MPGEAQHEPVRLTDEQLAKHVERLTNRPQPRPIQDPFPICPSMKLSQAELDNVTQRVYYQYRERHEAALVEAAEKEEREVGFTSKKLSSEEIDDSVKRLYYEAIERRNASRKEAEGRLLFKSTKDVPRVPLKRFVEDMYEKGVQREKDKQQKLYEKYILSTEIKTS
ncbi:hypothetical protein DQ04_11161020 [Trypanosoma grayi]|uniref:hypothetical protein n=1 Tax=Trypanosoma grayi TaxID=71804 RepID=UPI0004F42B2D|nr:hypothetical protein DQ04_11161020 [Trypanosoma grayi]KEG07038.1 hypothetical protein DQ04_11161020 [Trypanosoma grayi]